MSKVSRGQKKEKMCADQLKAKGWKIWKTIRHRFLNIDVFGAFDVIAYKPGQLRFIQVTTGSAHGKRDYLRTFRMPPFCTVELWIYKNLKSFKGFDIEIISPWQESLPAKPEITD